MKDPEENRNKKSEKSPSELPPPTRQEKSEFKRLQMIVENEGKDFIEIGAALMKIYDQKLWRAGICKSWEDYCRSVEGMSRSRAYRLMEASQCVVELQVISELSEKPEFESQVRPLLALKSIEDRQNAWESAVRKAQDRQSKGKPTAQDVKRMVAERISFLDSGTK